ncbi:MAG: DUF2089 domain-containing protein [Cytophagales bacterium]|nr:DUF2089 domain-containing protein [Armatimonadota bacterium]
MTFCPACDSPLEVTELTCTGCHTRLQGVFPPVALARIAPEHQQFIEIFVRSRGIIREVERELGISYPTVRARLDAAVAALEIASAPVPLPAPLPLLQGPAANEPHRREILRQVSTGELAPAEAAERLRTL